jgi:Tfp pilus assembly protein PilF
VITQPLSPEQTLARVIHLIGSGEPTRAKALCAQALAASPLNAGLHQMLAFLGLQDGDIALARQHAAIALTLRPAHPPTLLMAGNAAIAAGDRAAALRYHSEAHALAPERADVALALGLTQHACGLLNEARQSLELAVERDAASEQAWFHLALVQQDLGDPAGAIHALQRTLALAPGRAEVEVNLGSCCRKRGVWPKPCRPTDAPTACVRIPSAASQTHWRTRPAVASGWT